MVLLGIKHYYRLLNSRLNTHQNINKIVKSIQYIIFPKNSVFIRIFSNNPPKKNYLVNNRLGEKIL